jgi:NADPH-dependent glutamate synthase beta subunit-like oxidoreductase
MAAKRYNVLTKCDGGLRSPRAYDWGVIHHPVGMEEPSCSRLTFKDPDYFHKVVDCQWACPAHTPVPEYIRLIAAGRYADAFMINWKSNVFPGILGRTCDRPCEPACRRGRVEEEPVAICRLKRVAADYKGDISDRLPPRPTFRNGKKIALVGAGPASLTVARDLAPLGYHCVIYDGDTRAGGMIRSQIPNSACPRKSSTKRSATSPISAPRCGWAKTSTV